MSIYGGGQPVQAFELAEILTVIVAGSPIPSHPSTQMIAATVESLRLVGIDQCTRIVLAHDGPPPGVAQDVLNDYQQYLVNLETLFSSRPNIIIQVNPVWGHLAGNIRYALNSVSTPFLLLCQHDFSFLREIDLRQVIEAMTVRSDIKHVRFNKNENAPRVWDCDPPRRAKFFTEECVPTPRGNVFFTRTIGWSDNNHLCRTDYYRNVILPLVGTRRIFPEHAANLAASHRVHDVLGTYIYGGLGEPATLVHLDGQGTGGGSSVSNQEDSPSKLVLLFQTNRRRISVAIDRMMYKSRIRSIRRGLSAGQS